LLEYTSVARHSGEWSSSRRCKEVSATTFATDMILGFGIRAGDCVLPLGGSENQIVAPKHTIARCGMTGNGIARPISIRICN
jgi:hypothetical protein